MSKNTDKSFKCEKCKELRELSLHLHELALFSELLSNQHVIYIRKKNFVLPIGSVHTNNIAKWLILASQLEKVDLNTYRYEEAHLYCEPVMDMLDSDAKHHETIATPLTRFMYISYALEECYKFTSPSYQEIYEISQKQPLRQKYHRNHSSQAAYLLEKEQFNITLPTHYEHLVENFLKVINFYASKFNTNFDIELDTPNGAQYGLGLVRNIRNQIAHGAFPIIDNPEYTLEFDNPYTKRNIINLLNQASRIAAINIQMLLAVTSRGFESDEYNASCAEYDLGEYFKAHCTFGYLLNLHISQEFGLNERDRFELYANFRDRSD